MPSNIDESRLGTDATQHISWLV